MSRITKAIAERVSTELIKPKELELTEIRNQLKVFITDLYVKTMPDSVMKVFCQNPNFFNGQQSVRLVAAGIDAWQRYNLSYELPSNGEPLKITFEEANKIIDFDYQINDKKKQISELKTGIEVALLNLRTYNNVEKEFPEAFKLLPILQANTSLMVNIKTIRCKLDPSTCD